MAQDKANGAPVLVIDTSGQQTGIALYDGRLLSTRSWPAARTQTTSLLAEIHHLLDSARVDIRNVAAIGVATGPGPFTGLRVGVSLAKGFHLATGAPLLAVSTLEAAALPFATCGRPIVAVVNAGRGRLVWAWYEPQSDGLRETRPPRNGEIADLIAELAIVPEVVVTGELDDAQIDQITQQSEVEIPVATIRVRQPAALAELTWRRWQRGESDDATALEPVYLSR
jgi:tRNA threonylcarbamoyladenosine biosynthesis protein TsaB